MILKAEIQMRPIHSALMDAQYIRFSGLDEFFAINAASENDWEYTVAWVDCSARIGASTLFAWLT